MANYAKANPLNSLATALGNGIADFANNTAQSAIQGVMGHNANLASAKGQATAAEFNAGQANAATNQNIASMANQYQFNAAQAAMANEYTSGMWQQTADWNERMWERQAEFNAEQAEIQRNWQERMANTQYQRAISDMSKAGLNPILAVTGGGVGTGVPGGATASVGGASMSSASGAMASGGLLGAEAGSISGYQGQGEFTGGVLGLLSQALGGMSTAIEAFAGMGEAGEKVKEAVSEVFTDDAPTNIKKAADAIDENTTPIDNILLGLTPGLGPGLVAVRDLADLGLPQWIVTKMNEYSQKKWNNFIGKAENALTIEKAKQIIMSNEKAYKLVSNYKTKG